MEDELKELLQEHIENADHHRLIKEESFKLLYLSLVGELKSILVENGVIEND